MTNTTATATPKVPFTSTPQFRAVWIISESIRKNLDPNINKITMLKEFLVYADMEEVFIQDNSDDVLSGIIAIVDDVLSGFNVFTDDISNIYNSLEVANG
jgi:hypothetical protein